MYLYNIILNTNVLLVSSQILLCRSNFNPLIIINITYFVTLYLYLICIQLLNINAINVNILNSTNNYRPKIDYPYNPKFAFQWKIGKWKMIVYFSVLFSMKYFRRRLLSLASYFDVCGGGDGVKFSVSRSNSKFLLVFACNLVWVLPEFYL